jgi:hypothetical protein
MFSLCVAAEGGSLSANPHERLKPDLSLNPDASPAALARRPLGAGSLVRWASCRTYSREA